MDEDVSMEFPFHSTMHNLFAKEILNAIKTSSARHEFARKILFCNKLFPKHVNINKFVGGFVVEELFTRLLNEMEFECTNVGDSEDTFDIRVCGLAYSLKSTSKLGNELIIKNHRGAKKDAVPVEPTFVIFTEFDRVRIVYMDQDIIDASEYKKTKVKYSDAYMSLGGGYLKYAVNHETYDDDYVEILAKDVPHTEPVKTGVFLTNYVSMMLALADMKLHDEPQLH
jgi:hypothetical protein